MVFHVTNYMRETNVWMIRKMRWIFWSIGLSIPIYRLTYWTYQGRRAALRENLNFKTEEQKRAEAEAERADWGYHPRYEPKYDFSIKTRKHALQTREEAITDTPRITRTERKNNRVGLMDHDQVRAMLMTIREHNRRPGVFDYNFP